MLIPVFCLSWTDVIGNSFPKTFLVKFVGNSFQMERRQKEKEKEEKARTGKNEGEG